MFLFGKIFVVNIGTHMLLPVLDNFVGIYYSYVNAISKSIVERSTELDEKGVNINLKMEFYQFYVCIKSHRQHTILK